MKLRHALRLGDHPCLAFVGAGGKTTAMFQLARQFEGPVLVTASTHLAQDQLSLADKHWVVSRSEEVASVEPHVGEGIILITGPLGEDDRTAGLDETSLRGLHALAGERRLPLLIEADGARQRPLKAPATHEPALPQFVDTVVVVAGLSAIGRPLRDEWVHRPERFGEVSGIKLGEVITAGGLAKALTSREGGLKNVPPGARQIALLNQADTQELESLAQTLAEQLLPAYHTVLTASLQRGGEYAVVAVHEQVAGIVLAAGSSERLGEPKQLLEWQDEPFVRKVARTSLEAGLSPVVVVLGAYEEVVRPVVEDLPVTIVSNPAWEQGQSTSVKAGLEALPEETGAAIFLLVDQPQVGITLLRKLVDLHTAGLPPIVSPEVMGRRGNPVLFDRVTFPDLDKLEGDVGGRGVFSQHSVTWLPWLDESIALDVDTLEDYQRLLNYED